MNKITKHKLLKQIEFYNKQLKYINYQLWLEEELDFRTQSRILLLECIGEDNAIVDEFYFGRNRGLSVNTWMKESVDNIKYHYSKRVIQSIALRIRGPYIPYDNKNLDKYRTISMSTRAFIGKGIKKEYDWIVKSDIDFVDINLDKWMGGTYKLKEAMQLKGKRKDWESDIK
jgi:hypothetical protein